MLTILNPAKMEKEFNERDSLQLITEMIAQAKSDLQKGSGNDILLWGYSVAAIALVNFALIQMYGASNGWIYAVWALCIPLLGARAVASRNRLAARPAVGRTGSMISWVWNAASISFGVVVLMFYSVAIGLGASELFVLIVPVIMTITGLALFATGKICRFAPCVYGSFAFWGGAVGCAALTAALHRHDFNLLVLAVCMVAGFVVPGHLLNRHVGKGV